MSNRRNWGLLMLLLWMGTGQVLAQNQAPVMVVEDTPLLWQYGVLIVVTITILGLMVILYRAVQKTAAQYPPELGDSLLRLWEVLGEKVEMTPVVWDDDIYRVIDPLARAIARIIQEEGQAQAAKELGCDDEINASSRQP